MQTNIFSANGKRFVMFCKDDGRQACYELLEGKMPLSTTQFNMPDRSKMVFADGGILMHFGPFGLLRNYIKPSGERIDRVAFWWDKAIEVQ